MVVMLGEAMGLVANCLAEFETEMLAPEADGLGDAGDVQQLFLLGQRDHPRRLHAQLGERVERGVELPDAAVDQNEVGIQLFALARVAIAAADGLAHRVEVIVGDRLNLVAAIAFLERLSVDEADLGGDRLAAAQMGDVEGLETADRFLGAEHAREAARTSGRVVQESRGLGLPVETGLVAALFPFIEFLNRVDLVAQRGGVLEVEQRACRSHLLAHLAQHGAAL